MAEGATVLVMENHRAKVGADGHPVRDAKGRLMPTEEITNIFVQQKGRGWGAEYPEGRRNGEWEYAWFLLGGTRKADAKVVLDTKK